MSVSAMAWAYRQATGDPTRKSILVRLADHADEHGQSYPGIRTIARYCEVNPRTVQRHLRLLEERGLIQVKERWTQTGRQTSHWYQLNLSVEVPLPGPDEEVRREGDNLSPSPDEIPNVEGGEGDNLSPSEGDNLSGGGWQSVRGRVTPVSPLESSVEFISHAGARGGEPSGDPPLGISHEIPDPPKDHELAEYLGPDSDAMTWLRSAERYGPLIGLGLLRQYGPTGTQPRIWDGTDPDVRPRLLATAIIRAGSDSKNFHGAFFASVLRRVVEEDRSPTPVQQARAAAARTPAGRITAAEENERDLRKRRAQQRAVAEERAARTREEQNAEATEIQALDAWVAGLDKDQRMQIELKARALRDVDWGGSVECPTVLLEAYRLSVARELRARWEVEASIPTQVESGDHR